MTCWSNSPAITITKDSPPPPAPIPFLQRPLSRVLALLLFPPTTRMPFGEPFLQCEPAGLNLSSFSCPHDPSQAFGITPSGCSSDGDTPTCSWAGRRQVELGPDPPNRVFLPLDLGAARPFVGSLVRETSTLQNHRSEVGFWQQ